MANLPIPIIFIVDAAVLNPINTPYSDTNVFPSGLSCSGSLCCISCSLHHHGCPDRHTRAAAPTQHVRLCLHAQKQHLSVFDPVPQK